MIPYNLTLHRTERANSDQPITERSDIYYLQSGEQFIVSDAHGKPPICLLRSRQYLDPHKFYLEVLKMK